MSSNLLPIERSEAQKAASRENGKASHGPVTPAGLARSSQNAIKHGLRSSRVVLANECQERYDALYTRYLAEWNPVGQTERDILTAMVNALWRKRRAQSIENGAINTEMFIQRPDTDAAMANITPDMRQADAVISIANANPSANDYFLRAEARLDKMFRNARKDLIEMQTMRLGHAPVLVPQPEPNLPELDNTAENPTAEQAKNGTYEPEAAAQNFTEPEIFAWSLTFIPTAARPSSNKFTWIDATDPRRTDLAA
jgi:hypothetical protein